jgi:ABC-type amino acid transport substrate-binding protein
MKIQEQLMQKHGLVAMQLAREWFTLRPSDRIGTFDEYARRFGTGRGTVQAAVRLLQEGAVALEKRGHLGTFLSAIEYEKLWQFTGFGAMMGVMPLPYSKLYEGLATGLYLSAEQGRIPFSLAYMRGAETRLQALASERYDFAVVSRLAAETVIQRQGGISVALQFGPATYVHKHAVVFASPGERQIRDGMRVGIDRTSIDQYVLTISQCQSKQVTYVDISYNQIIAKLQAGEIDAAIWNLDEVLERKLDFQHEPLAENNYGASDTEAVIVVRESDSGIKALLASFIKPADVLAWQRKIVEGRATPRY